MLNTRELKLWARSGSLRFALDSRRKAGPGTPASLSWNGHPVYYRAGTSDLGVIHSILLKKGPKAEYFVPRRIAPKLVYDIGGNIGCAALYFATAYPEARVLSFEPVPSNFELLEKNIAPYRNVRGFNIALGAKNDTLEMIESPDLKNFGGFSIYQRGAKPDATRVSVPCRSIAEFIVESGEVPDLIKVDTEGAEYLILTAIPEDVIGRVQWILGELHGENDFELLAWLSKWFEIGIRKSVSGPLCNFHARNRSLIPA